MTSGFILLTALLGCGGSLATAAPPSSGGIQILAKVPIGPILSVTYRFTTCPNGTTVVANSNGDMVVVDSGGTVVSNRTALPEVEGTTAITCDQKGQLYLAAKGWVRSFAMPSPGDLVLQQAIWVAGLPNRLLVTPDGYLLVNGMAKTGGNHVFLRRFRLSDGAFLEVLPVDLPVKFGASFNQLVMSGALLWDKQLGKALFIPRNPFQIWRLDSQGKAARVNLGSPNGFRQAEPPADGLGGRSNWGGFDTVLSAAYLSDGRILVQVAPVRDPTSERPGWKYSYLDLMDDVGRPLDRFFPQQSIGVLSGVDAEDNLYFVDLLVVEGGSVFKVRLNRSR